jgi:hypothetical protein
MILRTGKGGRYRCTPGAGCALHGRSVCAGRSLPMHPLDAAVTEAVAEQVLQPERQGAIRAAFVSREAEGAKARLMRLVATGALDPENVAPGDERRAAEARRRRAMEQVALLDAEPAHAVSASIVRFLSKYSQLGKRGHVLDGTPALSFGDFLF